MYFPAPLLAAVVVALVPAVSGHGIFLSLTGSATGSKVIGQGLGTEGASTDGHTTFYYAPRFVGVKKEYATCGVNRRKGGTKYYGIDWKGSMKAQIKRGVPAVGGDGVITARFFQNNHDGAGPFHCQVSSDASGRSWKSIPVMQNAPGNDKGLSNLIQQFHTLKMKLPSSVKCTGPSGVCLVRCKNPNTNPFGGCMVVKRSSSKRRRDTSPSEPEDAELLERDGIDAFELLERGSDLVAVVDEEAL